ncbi:MAG: UPF0179 family protein [Methanobacteriota archaeon]
MTLITLIGEHLAETGRTFQYLGPNNDCRQCKLKTVCFNLKPGRSYEIISIREHKHTCMIHEGLVVPVEVKELPILTTVNDTLVVGDIITIERGTCHHIGCPEYELCTTPALHKEKTYTVIKTYEKIPCLKNMSLQKAELNETTQ